MISFMFHLKVGMVAEFCNPISFNNGLKLDWYRQTVYLPKRPWIILHLSWRGWLVLSMCMKCELAVEMLTVGDWTVRPTTLTEWWNWYCYTIGTEAAWHGMMMGWWWFPQEQAGTDQRLCPIFSAVEISEFVGCKNIKPCLVSCNASYRDWVSFQDASKCIRR